MLLRPSPPTASNALTLATTLSGGLYGTQSKYGDYDITGEGAMEFFTSRRKITTNVRTI